MNLNLKAVYYCQTNARTWGKGYTPEEAQKNAKVKKGVKYATYAAALNDPTPDELKNLYACITANPIDGAPNYYKDNRTEEDTEMIDRLHVGWLIVSTNF